MVAIAHEEIRDVLSRVTNWPAGDRILLARKILETLETTPVRISRGYSPEEVNALVKMPQPAPSDAECRQILEEELLRKYGS